MNIESEEDIWHRFKSVFSADIQLTYDNEINGLDGTAVKLLGVARAL